MATTASNQPPRQVPKVMNQMMSFMLRSPLHRMISSQIVLLSFRGRKTGKLYTIPVGYSQEGQQLTICTDHSWYKNLRYDAPVMIVLRGQKRSGKANAVLDADQKEAEFQKYLQKVPAASRAFGVERNAAGEIDQQSMHQAANRIAIVHIQLV